MNNTGQQVHTLILNKEARREQGGKVQRTNIAVCKSISEIIKSTLGPKSMLKMLLDPMGGIVMTNDGNAILREIDVQHPCAKSMIELARAQDEEVGDGTTSVIILAGEIMSFSERLLDMKIHPSVIVRSYFKSLNLIQTHLESITTTIKVDDDEELLKIINSCLGTKFTSRWGDLVTELAVKAVKSIKVEKGNKHQEDD